MIKFELVGNALRGLEKAAREAAAAQDKAITKVAMTVMREAKNNARQNFKRGPVIPGQSNANALARSIIAMRVGIGRYEVGSNLIYARIREFGGTIVPRRKKFLSWWTTEPLKGVKSWKYSKKGVNANIGAAAHRVFAKRAVQTGKPYLSPAVKQVNVPKTIETVMQPWLKDLEKL